MTRLVALLLVVVAGPLAAAQPLVDIDRGVAIARDAVAKLRDQATADRCVLHSVSYQAEGRKDGGKVRVVLKDPADVKEETRGGATYVHTGGYYVLVANDAAVTGALAVPYGFTAMKQPPKAGAPEAEKTDPAPAKP